MNGKSNLPSRPRHLDYKVRVFAVLLLAGNIDSLGCLPSGQRLLHFELTEGQTVVASAWRGVPDSTPVPRMWAELPTLGWEVDSTAVPAMDASILELQLHQPILVQIKHANQVLGQVTLKKIDLYRRSEDEPWRITEDSYQRILNEIHR